MAQKPPFDTTKWSFVLVAFVICTHCMIVIMGMVFCWIYPEQTARCENLRGQLIELLAGALAAALAFAGARTRGP